MDVFAILGLSAEEPDLSVGAIHHAWKQAVRHVIAGGVRPHLVTKISLHGLGEYGARCASRS